MTSGNNWWRTGKKADKGDNGRGNEMVDEEERR